jgi:plastocyanin
VTPLSLWVRYATAAVLALAGTTACASEAAPRHHRLNIRDAAFQPGTLAVAVGDTVTWVNGDIVPHTVTALDGAWDSDELPPGEQFTLIVAGAEATPYYCRYHPTMVGVLEERSTRPPK